MGSKAGVSFSRVTLQPLHEEIAKYCIASSAHNPSSTANKGWSPVSYREHPPLTAHIYLVMIIATGGFSKKLFFGYFYFLEILLNYLELVFLEFKHINRTQRTSLFSSYLFIFLLICCFIIILCINALHLFVFFHFM